jgi:hypothetical protein
VFRLGWIWNNFVICLEQTLVEFLRPKRMQNGPGVGLVGRLADCRVVSHISRVSPIMSVT